MTTSESYFKQFVKNISPDDKSSKNAQNAHNNLRDHLEWKTEYKDSFLYGSYKRATAIHDIDDVDICMLLDIDINSDDWKPKKVLKKLKKDISEFYSDIIWYDENNTDYNRRSILVKNALPDIEDSELTLDVIPAVETGYDYLLVPDRELEKWVKTNPKWHINFSQVMNTDENSNWYFISVVKMFKHLKKFHIKNKHPKGFWIETLVWLNYKKQNTLIESFYGILVNILNKFWDYKDIPNLKDIWLEKETIKTSMEFKDFEKFINLLKNIKDNIDTAINSNEKEFSLNIYRYIFWEEYFPIKLEKEYNDNSKDEFITKKYQYKEYLDDKYYLNIECKELSQWATLYWKIRQKIKIPFYSSYNANKKEIKFEYSSNCPQWTIYLWKVRNYWDCAKNDLRWEIWVHTNSKWTNVESIAYYWTHTVECYGVYNKQIIAKDLFYVNVYE